MSALAAQPAARQHGANVARAAAARGGDTVGVRDQPVADCARLLKVAPSVQDDPVGGLPDDPVARCNPRGRFARLRWVGNQETSTRTRSVGARSKLASPEKRDFPHPNPVIELGSQGFFFGAGGLKAASTSSSLMRFAGSPRSPSFALPRRRPSFPDRRFGRPGGYGLSARVRGIMEACIGPRVAPIHIGVCVVRRALSDPLGRAVELSPFSMTSNLVCDKTLNVRHDGSHAGLPPACRLAKANKGAINQERPHHVICR